MLLFLVFGAVRNFDVILVVTGNPHRARAQILDFFISPKGLLIKFQRWDRLHKNCLSAYGTRPSIYCFTSVRLKKHVRWKRARFVLANEWGTWELIGLVGHVWHEPWKILVRKKGSMGSVKLCLFFNPLATKWIQPNEPNQSQTNQETSQSGFPSRTYSVYQVGSWFNDFLEGWNFPPKKSMATCLFSFFRPFYHQLVGRAW